MTLKRLTFPMSIVLLVGACLACNNSDDDDATETTSSSETNPNPAEVTDCSALTGVSKVICLADAFKAQLTSSQLSTVQRTYSTSEAKKWSNFPEALYGQRVGLDMPRHC